MHDVRYIDQTMCYCQCGAGEGCAGNGTVISRRDPHYNSRHSTALLESLVSRPPVASITADSLTGNNSTSNSSTSEDKASVRRGTEEHTSMNSSVDSSVDGSLKSSRDSTDIRSSRDSIDIRSSRDSIDIRSSRDSIDIRSSRDSIDIRSSRDSIDIRSSGDGVDIRSSTESQGTGITPRSRTRRPRGANAATPQQEDAQEPNELIQKAIVEGKCTYHTFNFVMVAPLRTEISSKSLF
jgi:hypothetical protein